MRRRRPPAPLTLIAAVAVISGCGSSTAPVTAAGVDGSGAIAVNTRKAVRFAECMRGHGVSQFPDPSPSGRLTIDAVANGSRLNPDAPAFRLAVSACKNLEPTGFTGNKRSPQQQQAALAFARCIRANGVADFPDPEANGPLIDTNRIPSAGRAGGMSALRAAMPRCRGAAAAAGVTR